MISVILAAGYATRLYPLTENFPKPLLTVKGKTILDWLIDDIDNTGEITRHIIVSNHRYVKHFEEWAAAKQSSAPITILDDGTSSNETRLGAVRDVQFAIESLGLDDDLLVAAGDNLLDFPLRRFISYFRRKRATCIFRYAEHDANVLRKAGVLSVDGQDRITRMVEKPTEPFSQWCAPAFYIYRKADLPLVAKSLNSGAGADAPGSFIAWLSAQVPVYAMEMPGKRYDIGDVHSYNAAQKDYPGVGKYSAHDNGKTLLVTGAAGFVGFHLCKRLLDSGARIVGFDSINDYYDVSLKHDRLDILKAYGRFRFVKGDLADEDAVRGVFDEYKPSIVAHLAAQAGVRYSITNPRAYIDSNLIGFFNILESVRRANEAGEVPVEHLLYASSSSVYGNQRKTPFSVTDDVSTPISLYAATKKSNELMAYTYSHLYRIPATGLRFFTVYGPYGRPDMAYFSFAEKIMEDKPIQVFNNGDMYRDFTYVDDVVGCIARMLDNPPVSDPPAKIYNIGNHNPERLTDFIAALECALGRKAVCEYLPMQPSDVYQTYADVTALTRDFDYKPDTPITVGLGRFAEWYLPWREKKSREAAM
jgi:UDP-glucuronate 4-epimerase